MFTYLYECIGSSTCHSTYVEVGGQLTGISPFHTDRVWWQVLLPIEPSASLALDLIPVGETWRYSLVVKNTCCGARSLAFLALPFPFDSALHSRTQLHVECCLCLVSSCPPPPPHLQPGLRWDHLSLPSKKLVAGSPGAAAVPGPEQCFTGTFRLRSFQLGNWGMGALIFRRHLFESLFIAS